jgi:DNA gyrase subunit A
MGRATQGVTLINVDEGTQLSGLQRVAESDDDSDDQETVEGSDASQDNEGGEPENV